MGKNKSGSIQHNEKPQKRSILGAASFFLVLFSSLIFVSNFNTSDSIVRKFSDATFSFLWYRMSPFSDKGLEKIKTELFKDVSGNVLEIGPGYGTTLKYLSTGHISKLVEVEPSSYFHGRLEEEGKKFGYQVVYINEDSPNFEISAIGNNQEKEKQDPDAENKVVRQMLILNGTLDNTNNGQITPSLAKNGPYDSVISSLVLCSVDQVEPTVDSIAKLLKSGGKFYFIEHVSMKDPATNFESFIYYTQRAIDPLWSLFGGNCHLSRKSDQIIKSSKHFKNVKITHVDLKQNAILQNLAPFVYGVAEKI